MIAPDNGGEVEVSAAGLLDEDQFVWLGAMGQRLDEEERPAAVAVYDAATGLTWLVDLLSDGAPLAASEIDAAVMAVGALGFKDWRLPSPEESESIAPLLCVPVVDDTQDGNPVPSEWLDDDVTLPSEDFEIDMFDAMEQIGLYAGGKHLIRVCRGDIYRDPTDRWGPVPFTKLPPWERFH